MLTDEELAAIETRYRDRKEFHDHVPSGPYFYEIEAEGFSKRGSILFIK